MPEKTKTSAEVINDGDMLEKSMKEEGQSKHKETGPVQEPALHVKKEGDKELHIEGDEHKSYQKIAASTITGEENDDSNEDKSKDEHKAARKKRTRKKKPVTHGSSTAENQTKNDGANTDKQGEIDTNEVMASTPDVRDNRAERNRRRRLLKKGKKQQDSVEASKEETSGTTFQTNEATSTKKVDHHSQNNRKKEKDVRADDKNRLVFDYEELERELLDGNRLTPPSIQFAPIPVNKKRIQSRQQQQPFVKPAVSSSSSTSFTAVTGTPTMTATNNRRDLLPAKLLSKGTGTNHSFSRTSNKSKPTAKNQHAEIPPPPSLIHDNKADKKKTARKKEEDRKESEKHFSFSSKSSGSSKGKIHPTFTTTATTKETAGQEHHPLEDNDSNKHETKKKRRSILQRGVGGNQQPLKELGLPVKPVIFVKEDKKHSTVVSVKKTSQATSTEKKRENREVLKGLKDINQVDYCHPDDIIRSARKKRLFFDRYMDPKILGEKIKKGTLHRGVIRINKRNRKDAYVTCDNLDADILIYSQRDRNRALDGDEVVVELLDLDTIWGKKKDAMLKRREERHSKSEDWPARDEEEDEKSKPKYVGKVVSIVKAHRPLTCVGLLSLDRFFKEEEETIEETEESNDSISNDEEDIDVEDVEVASDNEETPSTNDKTEQKKNKTARIAWFKPIDLRKPIFAVQLKYAPSDILNNMVKYKSLLMVGQITRWPIDSACPFGTVVRELGPIGNIPAETKGILEENHIIEKPFSRKALKCLPATPWSISDEEINKRRDLRNTRIFTIDPATAKDLDDAVHITKLSEDEFEVGVHIADVSHFVQQHTALDHEAFDRGTSTYLCDRVIPMLPSLLCEQLCSLNPGVERLAFSVIWKMDGAGQIQDTWFGKTVIKSCVKLAYDDAQSVIENKGLSEHVSVHNHEKAQVEQDIKYLYEISKQMRQRRFENGALSINSIRLSFQLNEVGEPCGISVYEQKDANRLIEEFMLCANMSVAKKISSHYSNEALLRHHSAPHERGLNDFIQLAEKLGYSFDASSAGSIQKSINGIDNEDVKSVLKLLLVKPMQRAKYFCTGSCEADKYRHYALNVPLYTHFTSPIRRFADIIVHRQLEAALKEKKACGYKKHSVEKATAHCNERKEGAKNAQDMNIQLYLSHYLHLQEEKSGKPIISDAIVTQVLKDCFEILVPEYGLEKRVHMDMLPIDKFVYDSRNCSLTVYWKEGIEACREFDSKRKKDENFKEPSGTELLYDTSEVSNDEPSASKTAVKIPDEIVKKDWIDKEKKTQQFQPLSKLTVRIQVNVDRSPPIVNIYPVNPFA